MPAQVVSGVTAWAASSGPRRGWRPPSSRPRMVYAVSAVMRLAGMPAGHVVSDDAVDVRAQGLRVEPAAVVIDLHAEAIGVDVRRERRQLPARDRRAGRRCPAGDVGAPPVRLREEVVVRGPAALRLRAALRVVHAEAIDPLVVGGRNVAPAMRRGSAGVVFAPLPRRSILGRLLVPGITPPLRTTGAHAVILLNGRVRADPLVRVDQVRVVMTSHGGAPPEW